MNTNNLDRSQPWPGRSDRDGPADAGCLIPLVTRAAELGRGPAWLVGWVRSQLAGWTGADAVRDPLVIRRLARELAGLLRPSGLSETVADRV